MAEAQPVGEVIEFQADTITQEMVDKFVSATAADSGWGIPPTFATLFRHAEYKWLDRLKVNWDNLLHGDQEYIFHSPPLVGVAPKLRTRLSDLKERKGRRGAMRFIKLETELDCGAGVAVVGRTTFVVTELEE